MIDDNTDKFINNYRESLDEQKDLANQNLANTRRNDFQAIMSGANTAGMMYSNFPERSKIQYDTQTYMPNQIKIQNTYQTGLQKLRENVLNTSNTLRSINDAISELNSNGGSTGGSTGGNNNNNNNGTTYPTDLASYYSKEKGYQFKDSNGNPIRLNTFAKNTNQNVWNLVEQMAKNGDVNAKRALAGYKNAEKKLTREEQAAWATLGLSTDGWGTRY